MNNILVPTDFSQASHISAQYAVALAELFDAKVFLINIVLPPDSGRGSVRDFMSDTHTKLMEQNKALMEKEISLLSKKDSIKIGGLVKEGFLADEIAKEATEVGADIIVMGMKGEANGSSVFGSTTLTIVRESLYPVFVIPEEAIYKPIENITFASDFNSSIEIDKYTVLLDIATKFKSQINILNVQKNSSSMSHDDIIGKMKISVAFSKHNHRFKIIAESNIEDGINRFIEKNETDILVMVARKHSIFYRLFAKMHTQAMSYQTKIPLLILQNE